MLKSWELEFVKESCYNELAKCEDFEYQEHESPTRPGVGLFLTLDATASAWVE